MPCQDSSSSMHIVLNHQEQFISFRYAKITCSSEISPNKLLNDFLKGKKIDEALDLDFYMLRSAFGLNNDEESAYILYLELDALKAAISQYLGYELEGVDHTRAVISSVEHNHDTIEVALVILPPKELPKIIPCSKS